MTDKTNRIITIVSWLILFAIAFVATICLSGCFSGQYEKELTYVDRIERTQIDIETVGKDFAIDPNGYISLVSKENEGILEAGLGFLLGWLAF